MNADAVMDQGTRRGVANSATKIQELQELNSTCDRLRGEGRRIVHCHGVFDLLHIGHIKHFEAAKRLGDVLIVTLTADQFVNKGPGRPAFSEDLRAEAIAALSAVDYVAINTSASAVDALSLTKPHRYVKGADYKDRVPTAGSKMQAEIDVVRSFGGDIAFTEEPQFSSSKLLNDFLSPFSPHIQEKLKEAKSHISLDEIQRFFVELEGIHVVVQASDYSKGILTGVFPGVTVQPDDAPSPTHELTTSSDRSTCTLHLGVTNILAKSEMSLDSFSMPRLSELGCAPGLLQGAADILAHHPSTNVHLHAVFLAVFNQEARPGVTLASLRKVTESILK